MKMSVFIEQTKLEYCCVCGWSKTHTGHVTGQLIFIIVCKYYYIYPYIPKSVDVYDFECFINIEPWRIQ